MMEYGHTVAPKSKVLESGFNAMGQPIPNARRQAAYNACAQMGFRTPADRWCVVNAMAEALERDKPYEAIGAGMANGIDLTGAYRVMAHLLT